MKVKYEKEDDVLNIWLSQKLYDYAEDEDGVIIHYTKDRKPVYIEILDASRFLGKRNKPFYKKSPKEGFSVAVSHQIRNPRRG